MGLDSILSQPMRHKAGRWAKLAVLCHLMTQKSYNNHNNVYTNLLTLFQVKYQVVVLLEWSLLTWYQIHIDCIYEHTVHYHLKLLVFYFTMYLLCPLKSSTRTPPLFTSNIPMPGKITSRRISIVSSPFEFYVLEHVMYISLSGGYWFPEL